MEKFYLSASPLPRIHPKCCGRLKCEPSRRVGRPSLERYVLHYVLNGNGTFHKHGKTYPLASGDLFISCPDQPAFHIADEKNPMEYIWISLTSPQGIPLLHQQDVIQLPDARRLFLQMIGSIDDPARDWSVHSLIYQLFAVLAARPDNGEQQKDYLRDAIAYIEEHYDQHLQVDHIAKLVGMSRSHFSRLFKRQTGVSPQDYIVAYRLEMGARLLVHTDLMQKEIAAQLGYPDVTTFSKIFKRKYGVSPGKYRKNNIPPQGTAL